MRHALCCNSNEFYMWAIDEDNRIYSVIFFFSFFKSDYTCSIDLQYNDNSIIFFFYAVK